MKYGYSATSSCEGACWFNSGLRSATGFQNFVGFYYGNPVYYGKLVDTMETLLSATLKMCRYLLWKRVTLLRRHFCIVGMITQSETLCWWQSWSGAGQKKHAILTVRHLIVCWIIGINHDKSLFELVKSVAVASCYRYAPWAIGSKKNPIQPNQDIFRRQMPHQWRWFTHMAMVYWAYFLI